MPKPIKFKTVVIFVKIAMAHYQNTMSKETCVISITRQFLSSSILGNFLFTKKTRKYFLNNLLSYNLFA